ncbi:hypothetical protein PR048_009435 [Dryococelus australis]|uniref:Uncharacterized protein n=1 Tax=Dryococelus australis TaxID=614101 RepID=A0ABQ9I0Z5_9NEOP|nr:hypothetical protein PR048_009435 [Dryococelus australis]
MGKYACVHLTPGKSLCLNCYSKIFVLKENYDSVTVDKLISVQENLEKVYAMYSALDLSPVSKIKRLNKLITSFSENILAFDEQEMSPASNLVYCPVHGQRRRYIDRNFNVLEHLVRMTRELH